MTTAKTFTTSVIAYDAASAGDPPQLEKMELVVEFHDGKWTVFQVDIDAAGNRWNSTPVKTFGMFEVAVAWARHEEAGSL